MHEKELLENSQVAVGGLVIKRDAAADFGEIDQITGELGGELQQPRDLVGSREGSNLWHVPLYDGFDIGTMPVLPSPLRLPGERFWISATCDHLYEPVGAHDFGWLRRLAAKGAVDELGPLPAKQFAALPRIDLDSPKFTRKLTTAWFVRRSSSATVPA